MVNLVLSQFANKKVGLIGTKRTIQSGIYARKIKEANQNISLASLPTPLLVPMIEEGFFNNKISHDIIEKYLTDSSLNNIDALILGCTHYPLIKNEISSHYHKSVTLLDSSEVVAQALKNYLTANELLSKTVFPKHEFLVSDYTDSFEASTRIFFREVVHLQKHLLWN